MLKLIPAVKHMEICGGCLPVRAICYEEAGMDSRLLSALKKLPFSPAGAKLDICTDGDTGEGYTLSVRESGIHIHADSPAGAFYAIQTLRQIFKNEVIPCLFIKDHPDFAYRGFYHDVTRGKVPTVATLKSLIDNMAYYKLNSLQLYVEHTFAFKEYAAIHDQTGFLTKEELLELGAYCRENFIDFIPSLSTFGHLYELLEQPQYQHLRVLKDHQPGGNLWRERMDHHTIDPLLPQSIALIESLIDQYAPCFESQWFNICCDETFDLKHYDEKGMDSGALYVEFVKKIIACVQKHGKKVMMWGDILLNHPEVISQLPDDVCFLNWHYGAQPPEESIITFAQAGKSQLVCPGTSTWIHLCEHVETEEPNICLMAEYGHRHGAKGMLITNWGDFGNPCSLELGMYGMVLGAAKSWAISTQPDDGFYSCVNALLYENENGMTCLKALSSLHSQLRWYSFCWQYFLHRYGITPRKQVTVDLPAVQSAYRALTEKLSAQVWKNDEYRQEMLLAAEGLCVMAELFEKLAGKSVTRLTDTNRWLEKYAKKWRQKNKESELFRILEVFTYCENATETDE